jgi:hypothetical protein
MKKYHQRPTLGVRSGTRRWKPYVADMNSQKFPVIRYDKPSSPEMLPRRIEAFWIIKAEVLGSFGAR